MGGGAAAVLLLLLGLLGQRAAAQEIPREYALKAGMLFHFCEFIDWPADCFRAKDAPLVIGVLGDNPFGSFLAETVRGEAVHGHPVQLEHYGRVEEARNCHLLFVCSSEASRAAAIVAKLRGRPVVTVGETGNFTTQGGMISLTPAQNRIRVTINLEAVRAAKIRVSSKLLRVAEITKS